MRVTFHGVRGSVPAPGPLTARYGGNTSCVDVRLADGTVLALDAGTGLRTMGNVLLKEGRPSPIHLLLSHTHWDHVMGLPFFGPLWDKQNHIYVCPLANDAQELFQRNIFNDIHFPVSVNDIPARMEVMKADTATWRIGSATVSRIMLNHPGGAQGFRIDDDGGVSLAYLTDNELKSSNAVVSVEELSRFAANVDILIHDSQYLAVDMPHKHGWGHSVVDDVLELGRLAEAKRLLLYHHDPDRTDDALDAIGATAQAWADEKSKGTQVIVASEGLTIKL